MMAGQYSTGKDLGNAGAGNLRLGTAYAEGVQYRASDTVLNVPITDNPLEPGSEAADAWDRGWTLANDNSGGQIPIADLGSLAPVAGVPI